MKWKYKCKVCGCYLDPGEGWICEDCRKERASRNCAGANKKDITLLLEAGKNK